MDVRWGGGNLSTIRGGTEGEGDRQIRPRGGWIDLLTTEQWQGGALVASALPHKQAQTLLGRERGGEAQPVGERQGKAPQLRGGANQRQGMMKAG